MAVFYCSGCQANHEGYSWRFTTLEFEKENREGWFCDKYFKPTVKEWVPERLKEDRKRYAKDIIQPYRGGEPSRDFIKEYPKESKHYFTEKEIKKANRRVI